MKKHAQFCDGKGCFVKCLWRYIEKNKHLFGFYFRPKIFKTVLNISRLVSSRHAPKYDHRQGKVIRGRAIANRCTMEPFKTLGVAVGVAFSVKAGAAR